jgi:integrase
MFLFINNKRSLYWQIGYEINGKPTSRSTRTRDRKAAEKFLSDFKKSFNTGHSGNAISLKDFIKKYCEYVELIGSKSYLKRSVIPSFNKLVKHTGNIPLAMLDRFALEKFLLTTFKQSPYSAYLFFRTLRAALTRAVNWGYSEKNHLYGFKLPKIQTKHPSFLSFDELQNILKTTNRPDLKDIFLFAFFTGLRLSEIFNLTWNDINFDKGIIQVGNSDFVTKSRKIRYVPMAAQVKEILLRKNTLRTHKSSSNYEKKIFKNAPDHISHLFKACVRAAGMSEDIHFHTLRASFGSYLLQQGVAISVISKLLGHSSITITEQYYVSLTIDNLKSAISVFDSIENSSVKSSELVDVTRDDEKSDTYTGPKEDRGTVRKYAIKKQRDVNQS